MNVRITDVSHHTQPKKGFISGKTGYDTITAKNESTFRFTNKLPGEGILHMYFTLVTYQAQKKLNTKGLKNAQRHIIHHFFTSAILKAQQKSRSTPLERRKAKLNIRWKTIKTKKEEDKNAGGKSTENSKCPKTNEYIENIMWDWV